MTLRCIFAESPLRLHYLFAAFLLRLPEGHTQITKKKIE